MKRSQRCDPKKPAAPVISTFFIPVPIETLLLIAVYLLWHPTAAVHANYNQNLGHSHTLPFVLPIQVAWQA
jgi:hypothetical protein